MHKSAPPQWLLPSADHSNNPNKKKSPSLLRDNLYYRAPVDLSREEIPLKNILLVGACLSDALALHFKKKVFAYASEAQIDHLLAHHVGPLPEAPPRAIAEYSFQVIQIPLREVMNERSYLRLDYFDSEGYKKAFEESSRLLELFLNNLLRYHTEHNLTTFVTNFLPPQQNPLGRVLPAYDLRNISYYVDQLNRKLSELVHTKTNVYLVNINEIAATIGRRYIQDDILNVTSHGAIGSNSDFPYDQTRLLPLKKYSEEYELKTAEFLDAIWQEIATHYQTLHQHDAIKIVICDLDDTLWRGVLAEDGIQHPGLEGWPLGVIEALLFLKKRGILLAIASNNEEETILTQWDDVFQNYLRAEDFVVKKINRKDKTENIQEILKEVHLLPSSALFIDDNPLEREKVERYFPGIRTLGADLYHIRRILLWAPELQVSQISQESSKRTELIQSEIERNESGALMTREEFLESLKIRTEIIKIENLAHPAFKRAFELLNKTNQFNTTGKRWTLEECTTFFQQKGFFYAFKVSDTFISYGLAGLIAVQENHLLQYVMSCRVLGLDVEKFVLTRILHYLNYDLITAELADTGFNLVCRNLYHNLGFVKKENCWCYEK